MRYHGIAWYNNVVVTNDNKTESEKDMKHFTLNNKTIIRSEKQAAAEFIKIHAKNDKIKEDLSTLKSVIKTNSAFDWAANGIKLSMQPTKSFDQKGAINLLITLGATEEEINNLTRTGKTQRVELAK